MTSESQEAPRKADDLASLIDRWSHQNPEGRVVARIGSPTTQGRLRRLIGAIAIASALDGLVDEEGRDRLVIKGGTALEMRLGLGARTSKDLDAAFRGETAECLVLAQDALERGWNGFTGLLGPSAPITRAKVIPPPVRVEVKVRYRGKSFVTIPLEISVAEGDSVNDPDRVAVAIDLIPVHLEAPASVALLPLRYQIAQKLHACTERFDEGENHRVRDLFDLMLMRKLCDGNMVHIKEACVEIFSIRDLHEWPPTIVPEPSWAGDWAVLAHDEEVTTTFADALAEVSDFVVEIDSAH